MDPLTAAFERFRRGGDLDALGAVFDGAAPRLFALAVHLCGNVADAEDIVQQTFVVAMQRAATFDPARAVEPWLAGLCANLANNARRRAQVRRAAELPDLPAESVHGAGAGAGESSEPIAAAERSELVAALRRHVEALPPEQRTVLLLRLQHGLSAGEIAEALQVAPGTVRMRLHRGLQALRRVLPAGFATVLAGLFAGRGLAAVRASVLAAARATVTLAAGTGLATGGAAAGVLLMKKLGLGAVAILVLALGWLATRGEPPAPRPVERDTAPTPAAVVAATTRDTGARSEADAGGARTVRLVAADVPGSLRIRVVAVERDPLDGHEVARLPVPGLLVHAWPGEAEVEPFDERLHAGRTDACGEFAVAAAASGTWRAWLPADDDPSGPRAEPCALVVETGRESVLEVERPLRFLVRGVVVAADGTPVPDADVWVDRGTWMGRNSRPELPELAVRRGAVTDAHGRFAVAIGPREHTIGAIAAGHGASCGHAVGGSRDGDVRLVLGRAHGTLTGTVHDERGEPVAGALVAVTPAGQDRRRAEDGQLLAPRVAVHERTDAAGRFTVAGLPPGATRCVASIVPCIPAWTTVDVAPFAATSVDLQLQRGVRIVGTVQLADGSPVPAFVACRPSLDLNGHFSHCDTRADGSYVIDQGIPLRPFVVTVSRWGGALVAHRAFDRPEPGTLRCDFVIEDLRPLRGLVLGPAGEALARWRVRVRHAGGTAAGVTGADGRFRVLVPRDATCAVGAAPMLQEERAVVECPEVRGGETIVQVPASAMPRGVVAGRVVDDDGAPAGGLSLELHDATDDDRVALATTGTDGSFVFEGLPALRWQLRVAAPSLRPPLADPDTAAGRVDLGTLVLPRLAELRVRVQREDGSPWAGPLPGLQLRDAAGERVDGNALPVRDELRIEVPAGSYSAAVAGEDVIAPTLQVELAAGAVCERTVRVAIGRSRTLVCNGDGERKPAADETLRFVVRRSDGTTAAEGAAVAPYPSLRGFRFWPCDVVLPFGDYTFEGRSASGNVWRTAFTVREDLDDPTRIDVPRVAR